MTAAGEAEFRVALHPDKTGLGLGGIITTQTLERGFSEIRLTRVHLIVRKSNRRAIELYRRLGFVHRGECRKIINNTATDFFLMDILRHDH